MWGYYGSKSNLVDYYPPPQYSKVIEPFAGTARYSLKYFEKEITLVDKYEIIVRLWQWLQRCSEKDIFGLPRLKHGENVDDFSLCEEARWLIGFLITGAPTSPKKTAGKWKTIIRPNTQEYKLKFIASNLYKIRHWKILHEDYKVLKNEKATWFIDPPYYHGGEHYKHGNKNIDYDILAEWCESRKGQVIVCENSKAKWLDFYPLKASHGVKFDTMECMYYRSDTLYLPF